MKPKVAIIGGGIAGLGCANILSEQMHVTLFEKNERVGGHANTIEIKEDDRTIPIDTGFMVFNQSTYPNFYKLLTELKTPVYPTDMSFSVQHFPLNLEWSGTGIKRAFAKKSNLVNLRFLRMVQGVGQFNAMCMSILDKWHQGESTNLTIEQAIQNANVPKETLDFYILPMMSSLWSATPEVVSKFPIIQLAKFMHSHGLLSIYGKLDWFTIQGGSQTYVKQLVEQTPATILTNSVVESITGSNGNFDIRANGANHNFDYCILACHADEALNLIPESFDQEKELLSKFKYSKNLATLHSDESVMPSNKGNWASWNYRFKKQGFELRSSTHYWMNSLQNLASKINYFVTLDENPDIEEKHIKVQIPYTHPIFTTDTVNAQEKLKDLNHGQNKGLYFSGSYFGYGFHEDAYASSVELARLLLRKQAS